MKTQGEKMTEDQIVEKLDAFLAKALKNGINEDDICEALGIRRKNKARDIKTAANRLINIHTLINFYNLTKLEELADFISKEFSVQLSENDSTVEIQALKEKNKVLLDEVDFYKELLVEVGANDKDVLYKIIENSFKQKNEK